MTIVPFSRLLVFRSGRFDLESIEQGETQNFPLVSGYSFVIDTNYEYGQKSKKNVVFFWDRFVLGPAGLLPRQLPAKSWISDVVPRTPKMVAILWRTKHYQLLEAHVPTHREGLATTSPPKLKKQQKKTFLGAGIPTACGQKYSGI